jgi:threonylcarbamoyladenosine tRNA methylthiotransferase MtaB
MKTIAFYTLGCKVNQSDTASMEKLFRSAGYKVVDFSAKADVYLVNTCVVTNMGQSKSRKIIHKAVRQGLGAFVVVTGCYPQTFPDEVKEISGVDLIVGNQDRNKIVSLVEEAYGRQRTDTVDAVHKLEMGSRFEEMNADEGAHKTRAFLKIQEGCNQFCTYCIIPYARGPLRSRSLSNITSEVANLVAVGFKEVVLIGIHLGAYGRENKDGNTLVMAVKAALAVPGLVRLRLGSLESVEVDDQLLDLMVKDTRVCPHLHLPLQAGCDKILTAMHRPYTTEKFTAMLNNVRAKLPNISITTDIIVGFPGEEDEDFAKSLEYIKKCNFSKIHIFPYSQRKGTPAETYKGQIAPMIKQKRVAKLELLDEAGHRRFCEKLIGQTVSVIMEMQTTKGVWEGLSSGYVRVFADGDATCAGKLKLVKVENLYNDGVFGSFL